MLSKLIALLLSALLSLAPGAPAISVPDPTPDYYVLDQVGVLDDSAQAHIVHSNDDLYAACGGQICVVAVKTTGGADIMDYAQALFNRWGIGSAERNNGVLILLAIDDDDYAMLTGKGIDEVITNGEVAELLQVYLEPDFAAKAYQQGALKLFDALVVRMREIYNVGL